MKKLLSTVAILSMAAATSATNLYTDPFNYTPGTALETNLPWQGAVIRSPSLPVASGNVIYPGLPGAGNSVQLNNLIGDTASLPLSINSGTVFYSMVLQLNAAMTTTNQPYFAGFDDNATGETIDLAASLVIKKNPSDATKLSLGIAAAAASPGNNNTKIYSPTAYATSDVLFVVGSYTFVPGAKNDVANLYVFANGAAIPSSVPATATATSTTAAGNNDYASITRFYLRDNTGEPASMLADELRIGTSWQDILPLAGDTNFDGRIGADDYALIDRGYARYQGGAIAAGTAAWTDGDFNADHAVDAGDFMLLDQALAAQGGALSPGLLAAREAAFGPGYVTALAVPEPAAVGLVGLALLRRRRVR